MTLTIGIIAKEGVVLASDSRMSGGFTANDTVDKIFQLSERYAVGIAGDGTLASHIFDLIKKDKTVDFTKGIHQVAEELREKLSNRFDIYYPNIKPKDRELLSILLIGYSDDEDSSAQIYHLTSEDNFIPRQSPAGHHSIGIPVISDYLLNRVYERGKIATEDAAKLAVFCIKETMSQDERVGGDIKVASLSTTKRFSLLSQREIVQLTKQCDEYSSLHKGRFYPEIEGGPSSSKDAQKEDN